MLSVCIPVYNYNIHDLLQSLGAALSKMKDNPIEIIVADDGSTAEVKELNRRQAETYGARFISVAQNTGRSAIRNLLCREAVYNNLLFLDCDSLITDEKFLLKYMPYLEKNVVVYGGTMYQDAIPEKRYLLHWKYGRLRETKPVGVRNSFPAGFFKTNNFMISRKILNELPFNEELKGYGHEDTLLGIELYQNEIEVIHIENPVIHAGLEDKHTFLSKTEAGVRNLGYLLNSGVDPGLLRKHIRVLNVFARIQKYGLLLAVKYVWQIFSPVLRYMILKWNSLMALDIYKLGYLCKIV